MYFIFVFVIFFLVVLVVFNGRCIGSVVIGKWGEFGICVRILICNLYGGLYKIGVCFNDLFDVKCCLVGIIFNVVI